MRIAANRVGRLTTRLLPPSHALVVSIHDVSPRTWPVCEEILAELRSIGLQRCSLLVVPDFHHEGRSVDDPEFCEWLRELVEAKCEVVIHGYHHQRERRAGETQMQKLITRIYTADEGEFYDMDRATAQALVDQARTEFREVGIDPEGFIAPAWLLSAEAEEGLRDAGVQYTARLRHVRDLQSGRTHASQSLVWSTRSAARRTVSLTWNRALARSLADNPLMRISIHPPDFQHPRIWKQVRGFVARGLASRLAFTYEGWITRQRTFVPASAAA